MTVSKIRLPDNTEHDIRAKYLIQSTSADAISTEFSARTTTEDAIANIQKIYGNTVKWNQIAALNRVQAYNSASIVASGTTGIWTVTASGVNRGLTVLIGPATVNHKYYVSYYVKTTAATNFRISSYNQAGNGSEVSINGIGYVDAILTQQATVTDQRFMGVVRTASYSGTFDMGLPMVVDLTEIYGSGNEPSTVAAFKADFPYDYYPYTTLTLLSNSATAIQSKDSGDNVIGNCDLNISTLTGKLNGTGSSVVIFPDGMKKAGTVYDEIVGNKVIKRVKSVDLGSLTFTYNTTDVSNTSVFKVTLSDKKGGSANMVCADYYVAGSARTSLAGTNMAMAPYNSGSSSIVEFTNSSYTDADSFETAMSGVMLYYELATPEEYILDNALQLQYPVAAGGTEMVLPATGTAPMKMDIIYGNAADAAATMSQNFISVDSMKEFLAALGTQMGGTWSMGYESGKHTFTFTSN